MTKGPLDGLRIFDMTRILAGPTATQVLGDLGADIIKIERPGSGDDTRGWGPPNLRNAEGQDTAESVYFNAANRNKRSVTINFADPDGVALAKRLIAKCDVLFENYKVGDLQKYGLGYDQIKAEFPRLVYCSLTGFGQTGPYAPRAGFDLVVQGQGGVMSITGDQDGRPAKVGVGIADIMTGMYCNIAILAALRHRDQTGDGQHIDLALLDTTVSWLVNEGMNFLHTGGIPKAWGTAHATIVPYQAFQTGDGYFILAVGNDGQFKKLAEFMGHAEWAADARFKTNSLRVKNRTAIVPLIEAETRGKSTEFWLTQLPPLGVPCGPVNTIDKVFADPQVQHRGMRIEMEHPATGTKMPYIGSPIKMSKTPVSYRRPPPRVGEHNADVLRELLDLSDDDIVALRAKGVI